MSTMTVLSGFREKEEQRGRLPVRLPVTNSSDGAAGSGDVYDGRGGRGREPKVGLRLPSPSPNQKRKKKGLVERIRHFAPSWFAVCMGTGAVSAIFHNFPYGNARILLWFGRATFFVNLFLFILFSGFTLARYIMFPQVWNKMIHHPVQSTFIGCFPMALATLINGAAYIHRDNGFGQTGFLYFVWAIWWIDIALSYASCFGMIYFMITRQEHTLEKMLATWLLPIVPMVVVSTSGGIIAQSLESVNSFLSLLTVICSFVTLLIGLSLSFMVSTTYLFRLIIHGLPPKAFIVSKFIPLGPLGQGGTACIVLAQTIADLSSTHSLPPPFFSDPLAGSITNFFGFFGALFLWANGLFWLWLGATSTVEVFLRNNVPFGVPFWGMTFPLGVYILLSLQLGATLNSHFFKVFGSILACCLFVLYTAIFVRSIIMAIEGSLFHAPDLDDVSFLAVGPEFEHPLSDTSRGTT